MPKLESVNEACRVAVTEITLPVSVIIPVRNEARNLPRCLESLRCAGQVYVIDSQSTDESVEIVRSYGRNVVQFYYRGGWPKKRQWGMDTLPLAYDWVLLMDADEVLTPQLAEEIRHKLQDPGMDGYYVRLEMFFLGRRLRHGGAGFEKLALFRRGKGAFECRLADQDGSMADMEVHEHVTVSGKSGSLKSPLLHHNVETFSHYIRKHDEYSNWEARVHLNTEPMGNEMPATLFGTQAQRRRWLKKRFLRLPGSPALLFLYRYIFLFGFLDGVPGLVYCAMQGIQLFHVKAKIYELQSTNKRGRIPC